MYQPPNPGALDMMNSPLMVDHNVYPANRPAIPDSALSANRTMNPGISAGAGQSLSDPMNMMMDQEICSMVVMRQKASEYWRREKRLVWDKCWDHMKQVYDTTGKESWQSRMFMPETPKVVETICANLYQTSMGPHTPIEWQPNLAANQGIIDDHNAILANDMDRGNFKTGWVDFLRTLAILGTSIGKVGYDQIKRQVLVKQRNKMAQFNNLFQSVGAEGVSSEISQPQEMTTKDWATFEWRDPYDIYPEPYTVNLNDKHWIIEKAKITNAELIDGANDPDPAMRLRNVNPALLSRSNDSRIQADPEKQARRLALMQQQVYMPYLDPDAPHELYEYWGPLPETWLNPNSRNDPQAKYRMVPGWVWVVDKQWVVRKQLNPFRDALPPYVRGHYIRIPGQWYGVGVCELMIGLQIELNELRNTRVDQTNISLNKILAVLKDKVPPGEWGRLRSAPGVVWLFEGVSKVQDAVQTIEYPPAGVDAYQNSNEIKQEIQEVTAATSATIGVGPQTGDAGANTFRGQMLNKQSSTDRFMLYARGIEQTGLMEAARKMYNRIYQYKTYDSVGNIIGPEAAQQFDFIPPEMLDQIAKLVPLGVLTQESKGVKLAQLEAFNQQFVGQWWYKQMEVARKECNEMGYPNTDQFVFSDDEVQQYNEARQQMMGLTQPGGPMEGGVPQPPPQGMPPGMGGPAGIPPQGPPQPQGRPQPPQHGNQPIAGNSPGKNQFLGARPALAPNGPGGSPVDMTGRPMG